MSNINEIKNLSTQFATVANGDRSAVSQQQVAAKPQPAAQESEAVKLQADFGKSAGVTESSDERAARVARLAEDYNSGRTPPMKDVAKKVILELGM